MGVSFLYIRKGGIQTADLKFDIEQFTSTILDYRQARGDIKTAKANLTADIENLQKNDWLSEAGDAFMDLYSEEWAAAVDEYVELLWQFILMLRKAKNSYSDLEEKAKSITFG